MAFGREVADAYISIHGDLAPFRRDLDKAEVLLQNFGRKIRGLAGLNILEDSFRFGIRFMQEIDRNAVRIANMVTLIGTAVSGVLNLTGFLAALSTDLAGLAGIGFLAPGFLTGFGIALGVTIAAFKDMKTELADLAPAFNHLQDAVSSRFWEMASTPIRKLVNELLPLLATSIEETATAMGTFFGEIASSFQNEATPERVIAMFDRLNRAIDIARGAIAPFTRAMVNLGEVGSKSFERFATWIVELANRFDNFITQSINNGDMDRWIEDAIEGFKNVGRAIDGAIGIVNALDSAFRAAGGGGLGEFADRLQAASDTMNSPDFQTAMTRWFAGARAAMDGFFSGIGHVGEGLASLAPIMEQAGGSIGQTLDQVGVIIREVFQNPTLQQGFLTFLSDISTSVGLLAPAAKPFADSLGGLLELMGEVLKSVAEVGAAILIEWGPTLDTMSQKLSELVGPLKETLLEMVKTLTPVLQGFSDNVLAPVVDLVPELLKIVDGLTRAIAPIAIVAFEEFGQLIREITPQVKDFGDFAQKAGDQGDEMAPKLRNGIQAIEDFLNTASSPQATWEFLNSDEVTRFNEDVNRELGNFWGDFKNNFQTGVTDINSNVNGWLEEVWNGMRTGSQAGVATLNEAVNQGLEDFWRGWGESITNGINNVVTNFQTSWDSGWQGVIDDIGRIGGDIWNGFLKGLIEGGGKIGADIIAGFTGWVEDIRSFFGVHSPSTLMAQMGMDIVQGFINGLQALIGQIGAVAGQIVQGFISGFTGMVEFLGQVWANISASFTAFIGGFVAGWNAFWAGLGPLVLTALGAVGTFVQQALANIGAFVSAGLSAVAAVWNAIWTGISTFVSTIWNNIVNFIQSGISRAQAFIASTLAAVVSVWNSNWSNISNFVSSIWNNIVNFVQSGISRAQSIVTSVLSAISSAWNSIWSSISSFVSSVWNNIVSFIQSGISRAQGIVSSVLSSIQGIMSGAWNAMLSTVSSAWNGMVSAVSSGVNQVLSFIGSLPGRILGALGNLWGLLSGAGAQIMRGFLGGLQSAWGEVQNFVGGIANWIAEHKGPLSYDRVLLQPAGKAIMDGLRRGLESEIPAMLDTLQSISDAATEAFTAKSMFETGRDAAGSLADGLSSGSSMVAAALKEITPEMTTRFGALGALVSTTATSDVPTAGNQVVFEDGAIRVVTPTEDPVLVASKVIDEFANYSKF